LFEFVINKYITGVKIFMSGNNPRVLTDYQKLNFCDSILFFLKYASWDKTSTHKSEFDI